MLYADLIPAIAVEAPGCPELMIERLLRTEVRQLYRSHRLWLHHDAAATISTAGLLTTSKPATAEIVEVRHVRGTDFDLEPMTIDGFSIQDYETTGTPAVVTEVNGVWKAYPYPSAIATVDALVQLAPVQGGTIIEDVVAQRHEPLYHHLVLGRLLAMPNQTWTAPQVASYHIAESIRLMHEYKRRLDGWTVRRAPQVAYGGI